MLTNGGKSMAEALGDWLQADLPTNFALSVGMSNGTENRVKPGMTTVTP
jgi:hypothetical protein